MKKQHRAHQKQGDDGQNVLVRPFVEVCFSVGIRELAQRLTRPHVGQRNAEQHDHTSEVRNKRGEGDDGRRGGAEDGKHDQGRVPQPDALEQEAERRGHATRGRFGYVPHHFPRGVLLCAMNTQNAQKTAISNMTNTRRPEPKAEAANSAVTGLVSEVVRSLAHCEARQASRAHTQVMAAKQARTVSKARGQLVQQRACKHGQTAEQLDEATNQQPLREPLKAQSERNTKSAAHASASSTKQNTTGSQQDQRNKTKNEQLHLHKPFWRRFARFPL